MNARPGSVPLQSNWVVQRRNVRLRDIIPDDGIDWLAILTDGYITVSGSTFRVRSFDELESLQDEHNLPTLSEIRACGLLIEGERKLPGWLISLLLECSEGDMRVRTSGADSVEVMDAGSFAAFASGDMSDDEMEATTASGAWYLRMRNDDALIFFAVPRGVAQRIISSFPAHVRSVPQEFIFAS